MLIQKEVKLFKSFLIATKILFLNSDVNLDSSVINTIISDEIEIKEKPTTEKLTINLKTILDNFD